MDNLTPQQRRKNMQNIRSTNTLPERKIEEYFKKNKIYFSRNYGKIFGKPDFIFRKRKIIIFVDSDFWHGHPKRCVMPKSNKKYWIYKIERNRNRDKLVNRTLRKDGWKVYRLWEYDIKKNFKNVEKKLLKILFIAEI